MGVHNHLPHLEDLLISEGRAGLSKISHVLSLLKNREYSNFSLKYDGSPSVFIGIDPKDKQFFVAKKSIFNKKPIIYKSFLDIYQHIKTQELRAKMCQVFDKFRYVEISGVVQGDLLFSKPQELAIHIFDTEEYAHIRPNVLGYNIHPKSDLYHRLQFADIGFVPHTAYTIKDNFALERCAMPDIEYPDNIFILSTKLNVFSYYERTGVRFKYQENSSSQDAKYFNTFVRGGIPFPKTNDFEVLYAEIVKKKTKILKNVMDNLTNAIDIRPAFLTKENKIIESSHEGLVYADDNFSVKLVNRHQFSHANFSELFSKGWN